MRNFHRCIACWEGLDNCPVYKIPRKIKKKLIRILKATHPLQQYNFEEWTLCYLSGTLKIYKPFLHKIRFFEKYSKELTLLKDVVDEPIFFNEKLRLSWEWEDDNGLYSYGGLMPFCYSEKEAGETWAYRELNSLIYYLTMGQLQKIPDTIKSDKDLLKFIRNYKAPKEWHYDDE